MKTYVENSLFWEDSFPPVYTHTSIAYLKRHTSYNKAKNGDMQAAAEVVDSCVKPRLITELRKKHHYAELLPVISNNRLPEALARKIGLKVHTEVYELEEQNRKNMTAIERLLYQPCFGGQITRGKIYIVVDDVVTQGGTISALRKYIMQCGGLVSAAVALASSADSQILPPDASDLYELENKFMLINDTLKKHNISTDPLELTRSQVKYLLRFNTLGSIIKKISKQDFHMNKNAWE